MPTNKELAASVDSLAVRVEKIEEALHMAKKPPLQPMRTRSHVVKTGETLALIARDYLGNPGRLTDILALNGLRNAEQIFVGQELKIPGA